MLTLEIVSDIVCPWCYIGTRRLAAALALIRQDQPGFQLRLHWRPFFLNPDTPPEGEPYLPFLISKFGSREKVEEIFERVRAAGRPYGLDYAFEKIALRANTLKAHRLLHWAQAQGNADALVERLFQAQFQRGEHVGDMSLLVSIAGECGYDAKAVADYLASDADAAAVREEEAAIRAQGISMVPTFILPGGQIIVGAEDPGVLAAGIRQALP
ncbi:MAG: DsbA family oxidoreductase [Rhodocyclaceae bacterium]|nr:DsbA family oxidoreductase [Rhodocyclaceae bacterium]MDZ4214551.1 DsbA family oxidoreductase [Rhodocyclaceae bacterium]